MAFPDSEPLPLTMLTTPSGNTSWKIFPNSIKLSGVAEEGWMTIVLPAAIAGVIFHDSNKNGKF